MAALDADLEVPSYVGGFAPSKDDAALYAKYVGATVDTVVPQLRGGSRTGRAAPPRARLVGGTPAPPVLPRPSPRRC